MKIVKIDEKLEKGKLKNKQAHDLARKIFIDRPREWYRLFLNGRLELHWDGKNLEVKDVRHG